jgi:hypothetical protein
MPIRDRIVANGLSEREGRDCVQIALQLNTCEVFSCEMFELQVGSWSREKAPIRLFFFEKGVDVFFYSTLYDLRYAESAGQKIWATNSARAFPESCSFQHGCFPPPSSFQEPSPGQKTFRLQAPPEPNTSYWTE